MPERKCGYKIVAYVDGIKLEKSCDPAKRCLKNLVWSGIGVKRAASQVLDICESLVGDAYVEGDCSKEKSN